MKYKSEEYKGMKGLKQIWASLVTRRVPDAEERLAHYSHNMLNRLYPGWMRGK